MKTNKWILLFSIVLVLFLSGCSGKIGSSIKETPSDTKTHYYHYLGTRSEDLCSTDETLAYAETMMPPVMMEDLELNLTETGRELTDGQQGVNILLKNNSNQYIESVSYSFYFNNDEANKGYFFTSGIYPGKTQRSIGTIPNGQSINNAKYTTVAISLPYKDTEVIYIQYDYNTKLYNWYASDMGEIDPNYFTTTAEGTSPNI